MTVRDGQLASNTQRNIRSPRLDDEQIIETMTNYKDIGILYFNSNQGLACKQQEKSQGSACKQHKKIRHRQTLK